MNDLLIYKEYAKDETDKTGDESAINHHSQGDGCVIDHHVGNH